MPLSSYELLADHSDDRGNAGLDDRFRLSKNPINLDNPGKYQAMEGKRKLKVNSVQRIGRYPAFKKRYSSKIAHLESGRAAHEKAFHHKVFLA